MAESQNRRPQVADESMANQTIGMDESMERSLQFSTSQNPVLKKKDQQGSATLPDIKDPKNTKQKMRINPRETTDKKSPSVRTQKKGLSFFDTAKLLDPDMYEDSDLDITLTDFAKFKGWMSQKPAKKPMPEVKASQDGSTDGKSRIPPPATKFMSNEPKRATSVGRSAPAESQPKVLPFPLDGQGSTSIDSKKKPRVPPPLPQTQQAVQPSLTDTGMSRAGAQLLDRYIDPMAPRTPLMTTEPPTQIPYKEDDNPAFRAVVNNALPVEKNIREHMVSRYSKNGRSGTSLAAPKLSEAPLRRAPTGSRVGLADTKMPRTAKGADSRTKVSNEWLFGREVTEEADPSRDRSFAARPPQDPRKQALRYRVLDDFAGNWSPRNRIDMLYPREKDLDTDLEPHAKQRSPLGRYYLHSTPEGTGGEYAFSVFNRTKPTIREHSQQETDRDHEGEFDHRKIAKGILGRFINQTTEEVGGSPEFQEDVDNGAQYGKERIPQPATLEGYSRDEFDEESDYEMMKAAEIRKKRVIEVAKLLHVDDIIKERQILDLMRLQLLEVQSKLQIDQRSLELERIRMLAPPEPEPVVSPRSGWITHYDPKPRIPLPKLTKTGKPVVSFAGFGKGSSIRYEHQFFQEEESRKSDEIADDDHSSDLGELEFEKYLIKFEELGQR